jgi:hypothetical protein
MNSCAVFLRSRRPCQQLRARFPFPTIPYRQQYSSSMAANANSAAKPDRRETLEPAKRVAARRQDVW